MLNLFKSHYGSFLLFLFFIKALILPISIPESILFGFLTIFSGWQLYLFHLRLQAFHQKQINAMKREIHQLKSISMQVRNMNTVINNASKLTPETPSMNWTGR